MYYTTREKAESEQKRWFKLYNIQEEIFDVPKATKWKYWLGSKESWEKECKIMERKLLRYKLKTTNKEQFNKDIVKKNDKRKAKQDLTDINKISNNKLKD